MLKLCVVKRLRGKSLNIEVSPDFVVHSKVAVFRIRSALRLPLLSCLILSNLNLI